MEILGEHCSGSSLNLRLLILFDNLFLNCFFGWIGDVCGVDFTLLLNPVGMYKAKTMVTSCLINQASNPLCWGPRGGS